MEIDAIADGKSHPEEEETRVRVLGFFFEASVGSCSRGVSARMRRVRNSAWILGFLDGESWAGRVKSVQAHPVDLSPYRVIILARILSMSRKVLFFFFIYI